MTATRRRSPLLELDPDLGALLRADRRELARRELGVEVHRLPRGEWSAGEEATNPGHVGLLLLDGVISREVVVSDTVSTELLGPGDVVRPWGVHDSLALLALTIRWNALTETRVALLDRRFGAALGHWPEINAALIDRVNDRAHRIATTQAISQLTGVDRRVLSLFWHLAERWGRMTPGGVAVPLTLSHRMLGQLVGARRPTVSAAMGDLAERGELVRRDDGTWLLTGDAMHLPGAKPERVIPIRRRLLAPHGEDEALPHDLPAHGPVTAVQRRGATAPVPGSELEKLRSKLTSLRGEAQLHVDALLEATEETRRLQALCSDGRERRARERAARAAHREAA